MEREREREREREGLGLYQLVHLGTFYSRVM